MFIGVQLSSETVMVLNCDQAGKVNIKMRLPSDKCNIETIGLYVNL